MKVYEIKELIEGKYLTENIGEELEVTSGFVGDLLSVVMGKAKEGCVWITIQGHINIVAVSSLVGMNCIIITENFKIDEATRIKSEEEGIPILSTRKSSYETAIILGKAGLC